MLTMMTSTQTAIRPAQPADKPGMLAVIASSGLFPPDGLDEIESMLDDYFINSVKGEHFWITAAGVPDDDGSGSMGVAYYAPERMTVGTWNVYLIAVAANHQGQGHGAALMRYIEQTLAEQGERVLLVETSGLPEFEATRAFYRNKMQYDEEGRIREFYKAGEDKIIFRKALN